MDIRGHRCSTRWGSPALFALSAIAVLILLAVRVREALHADQAGFMAEGEVGIADARVLAGDLVVIIVIVVVIVIVIDARVLIWLASRISCICVAEIHHPAPELHRGARAAAEQDEQAREGDGPHGVDPGAQA